MMFSPHDEINYDQKLMKSTAKETMIPTYYVLIPK